MQKDVCVKTDQESAMLACQSRIQQARQSRTTPANSPKGNHHANGRVEKGVQAFQIMARRMRLAVVSHLGVRLSHKPPVLTWLIGWVGGAHSRFRYARDGGKTPRERACWQTQSFVILLSLVRFAVLSKFTPKASLS